MKILIKLYPIILIIIFIFSCFISSRISSPLIDRYYAYPVNESPYPKSWMKVAAFSEEEAYITDLENIEKFKVTHSNVSFLLPKEKEEFFKQKLLEVVRNDNHKNTPNIKVEQLDDSKQRIELRIVGSKSNHVTRYEATDKEIVPLTYLQQDLVSAFYLLIVGIIGGVICCVIFNLLFKKYIKAETT